MNRAVLVATFGVLALCLAAAAAACGTEEQDTATTPATISPEATATISVGTRVIGTSGSPTIPGEEVEERANTEKHQVTLEDGTTYEDTIPQLVFRTAADPGDGYGYRVVADWVGDGKWLVTIAMKISRRSTDPPTSFVVRADFYFQEESGEFTPANPRAEFALTGKNPCTAQEIETGTCDLDEPAKP